MLFSSGFEYNLALSWFFSYRLMNVLNLKENINHCIKVQKTRELK